jgi:hypothetical protein
MSGWLATNKRSSRHHQHHTKVCVQRSTSNLLTTTQAAANDLEKTAPAGLRTGGPHPNTTTYTLDLLGRDRCSITRIIHERQPSQASHGLFAPFSRRPAAPRTGNGAQHVSQPDQMSETTPEHPAPGAPCRADAGTRMPRALWQGRPCEGAGGTRPAGPQASTQLLPILPAV